MSKIYRKALMIPGLRCFLASVLIFLFVLANMPIGHTVGCPDGLKNSPFAPAKDCHTFCQRMHPGVFAGQGGGSAVNNNLCKDECSNFQFRVQNIPACQSLIGSPAASTKCNSASGCQTEAAAKAQYGADDSNRAADQAKSSAQFSDESIASRIQSAQSALDEQARSLHSMSSQDIASFHADQALLNKAKSDFESGKPISDEYAGLARNPVIQDNFRLMAAYDQAKDGFKTLANDYQIQSQELAKTAGKANENSEGLKSIADSKAATAANAAGEKNLSNNIDSNEKKNASKDSEADAATKAALARLEKALEKINSKSQRDALRKKYLARLKNKKGSLGNELSDLDKEVDAIVAAEVNEEKKGSPLQSAIRDVASDQAFGDLNIDQAAKNLQDKVIQLEDERAGIMHDDPRTLFQRIHDSHESCQRRTCVNLTSK